MCKQIWNLTDEKAEIGRRIGIFGGAFNPIHYGHLLIAENALKQYDLDHIYFVPSGRSPHKDTLISYPHRSEMIKRAIADRTDFSVSDIEYLSQERNYTYITLENLKKQYPLHDFYFIMGGDSIRDFHHWREPQRICDTCHLLVAIRDEVDDDTILNYMESIRTSYHAKIDLVKTPNYAISSHMLRERIHLGQSVKYMIPDKTIDYILSKECYK